MALFVDIVTITVKAGDGGNGCVSFHREKFVQAGGPDGGDGGRGGDVIFEATDRMHTLMDFRYKRKFTAENGADGMSNRRAGRSGEPVVIEVPPGTVVRENLLYWLIFLIFLKCPHHRLLYNDYNIPDHEIFSIFYLFPG